MLSLAVVSCDDDDSLGIDKRLLNKTEIEFSPVDSATGKAYTKEEIERLELGTDIANEIEYLAHQPIHLKIWTQIKVLKFDVIDTDKDSLLMTVQAENSGKDGEGYAVIWKTSIKKLNIEPEKALSLKFNIVYDDKGVEGFPFSSTYSKEYKIIHRVPVVGPPLVKLFKKDQDAIEIKSSNSVESLEDHNVLRKVAKFNGSNNKIKITSDDLNFVRTDDFTMSLSFKTDSDSGDPVIIGTQNWSSSSNTGFSICNDAGKLRIVFKGETSDKIDIKDGTVINDNKWHNIAIAVDKTNKKFTVYLDSKEIASKSNVVMDSFSNGNPIYVGQDGEADYGDWFKGEVANISFYDYVLPINEIVSDVKLMSNDGASVALRVETNSGDLPVITDGVAVRAFDGTDDYATIMDEGMLSFTYKKDFSISFWMKTIQNDGDPVLIGNQDWESSGNQGLTLAHKKGELRSVASDGSNKVDKWYEYKALLNDDVWHHVTVSYDRDANMIIYVDGKLEDEKDMSEVKSLESGERYRIGQDREADYGNWFQGEMKKIVFYDYVITEQEVATLFANK
jgi:hypothetical protein